MSNKTLNEIAVAADNELNHTETRTREFLNELAMFLAKNHRSFEFAGIHGFGMALSYDTRIALRSMHPENTDLRVALGNLQFLSFEPVYPKDKEEIYGTVVKEIWPLKKSSWLTRIIWRLFPCKMHYGTRICTKIMTPKHNPSARY